jgi:hypothetical protein
MWERISNTYEKKVDTNFWGTKEIASAHPKVFAHKCCVRVGIVSVTVAISIAVAVSNAVATMTAAAATAVSSAASYSL